VYPEFVVVALPSACQKSSLAPAMGWHDFETTYPVRVSAVPATLAIRRFAFCGGFAL